MKNTLLAGAIAFTLAASAVAQTDANRPSAPGQSAPGTGTAGPSAGSGTAGPGITTRRDDAQPSYTLSRVRASNLIGATVEDGAGNDIGEVEDLVIGSDNSVAAIVSVGGFLGLGEKRIAVPYDKLLISRNADKVKISYTATKDQLKAAPEFGYDDNEPTLR